ncbi:MAG: leucine--tRNA ligase [Flavobacteriales bacterium]|nr:leucine--tRNA ligase [Flavobacteriales bacterium]
MSTYNFRDIERKWQQYWQDNQLYKVEGPSEKPKYYVLDMFPYPSGAGLHVGHPLGYIASDIVSRFKRLQGYNVLHPMGFDAFGLPAEQYAIETGQHPSVTTDKNIIRYKEQLKNIGFCYDWDREVRTSDPDYYKWTQWIFIQMYHSWFNPQTGKAEPIQTLVQLFEKGERVTSINKGWNELSEVEKQAELKVHRLAYKDVSTINWCEALGTVLANDEVINGVSERGGHPVVRKEMSQWFLRITKFADRLLEGLEWVDFPESLKEMQRNWIGRSEGMLISFKLIGMEDLSIQCFTTRPDTIFGVSFMVLAPEHPLLDLICSAEQTVKIEKYKAYSNSRSELERKSESKEVTGEFTGAYVLHPFTDSLVPVYIADYVLMGYGTGAIMAVPSGDSRDYAFARKFNLPIPNIFDKVDLSENAYEEKNAILINSSAGGIDLNGMNYSEASSLIMKSIEDRKLGKRMINYRMRDAGFSRQRYWGEPFPVKYSGETIFTETLENLPVTLPEVESYKPTGDGRSPLAGMDDWVKTDDGMVRETDTMPGYAGSSWYYLRYMDPDNQNEFCDRSKSDYWNQVDLYVGGAEHAVGHLLYSRMWCKVLHDLGYIGFDEPYKKLINQGMIGGVVYYCYYNPEIKKIYSYSLTPDTNGLLQFQVPYEYIGDDENFQTDEIEAFCEEFTQFKSYEFVMDQGNFTFEKAITKMSKRLRNVVNPDEVIENYGTDAFRMYEMFLGPIDQDKPWATKGIDGVSRFLKRFWSFYVNDDGNLTIDDAEPGEASLKLIHRTLKKVQDDIERYSFNTCISSFMICLNELQGHKCRNKEVFKKFVIMMSPFAPHICEELWQKAGFGGSVLDAQYPEAEEKFLKDDDFNYPVSVNGKMRLQMNFALNAPQSEIENSVLANEIVQKWMDGKPLKKFIFVKGRIINVVV